MFAATRRLVNSSVLRRPILLTSSTNHVLFAATTSSSRRNLSFSFAGPKTLDDILKKDLVKDKTPTEISDLWYTYHEGKENVHGIILDGNVAPSLLERAATSPFFIQPIFREDGYFMLVSQFMEPYHFVLAYLEDYKMDPASAQPLLTFSVFDDYATKKNLTLVRADILNRGINDEEGMKVVRAMLDHYANDDEYTLVKAFNSKPDTFDIDDFIAQQNAKWKQVTAAGSASKTIDVES
ncbi:ATP11 protein [Nitzschia inconspicua]|uniref:ATP11 protein n=1 Tax=Nitzschia inconspicua TaxID=303405 RepID=A0A9K3LXC0_9STRA|nr:ATP11 protein [Nitzschia inconspicua]